MIDEPNDSPPTPSPDQALLLDPDFVIFSGEDEPIEGTVELQSLREKISSAFHRPTAEVAEELDTRLDQVRSMVEKVDKDAGDFRLSEVTVELGFSAEGTVVFVAKAGIQTTIAVKFARRP
jgi:Trypsin-co-occurring domain 1